MDGLKARLSFDAVAYDYDDEYLTIDTDTHIININNVSRLFGVQYDGNSKLIKFRIRNQLSEIQKMQDSIVYINWIDSKGVKGQSIVIDKTISNDICEFAWKVPFDALKNSRVLHFAMSAVITENSSSVINQRWSTQIASVIIPDGIYIKSYTPSSEEEDRIAQIYNELSRMINKQNDDLKADIDVERKRIDVLNDGGLIIKDELIENSIKTWLVEHPEATTTVQDGSIVEIKINKNFLPWIKKDFVTPQMFGGKGDGINDDTVAIQSAINTNKPVFLPKGTYKITNTIRTTNDFYCEGTLHYTGTGKCFSCGSNFQNIFISRIDCDNFTGTAITIENNNCHGINLYVKTISNANIGINLIADSVNSYIQYCNIKFDWIEANTNINAISSNNGWINHIIFTGGELHGTLGIKYMNLNEDYIDSNMFYNFGFEGLTKYIELERCQYFRLFNSRMIESENKVTDKKRISLTNVQQIEINTPIAMQYDIIECDNGNININAPLIDMNVTIIATHLMQTNNNLKLLNNDYAPVAYFNVNEDSNIEITDNYNLKHITLTGKGGGIVTFNTYFTGKYLEGNYFNSYGYEYCFLTLTTEKSITINYKENSYTLDNGLYFLDFYDLRIDITKLNDKTITHITDANLLLNIKDTQGAINTTNYTTNNIPNTLPGIIITSSGGTNVYQYFLADKHIYSRSRNGDSISDWTTII